MALSKPNQPRRRRLEKEAPEAETPGAEVGVAPTGDTQENCWTWAHRAVCTLIAKQSALVAEELEQRRRSLR